MATIQDKIGEKEINSLVLESSRKSLKETVEDERKEVFLIAISDKGLF